MDLGFWAIGGDAFNIAWRGLNVMLALGAIFLHVKSPAIEHGRLARHLVRKRQAHLALLFAGFLGSLEPLVRGDDVKIGTALVTVGVSWSIFADLTHDDVSQEDHKI